MIFRNFEDLVLGTEEGWRGWRQDALSILDAAVSAVEPEALVRAALPADPEEPRRILLSEKPPLDLRKFRRVRALAVGKAAERMMQGADGVLPVDEGLVVSPAGTPHGKHVFLQGGHPLPDDASVAAGEAALAMARATGENDLFVVLLSGGSSACLEAPEVPVEDLAAATRALQDAGADIWELNTVRKHLSRVKGGRLAKEARGTVLTLVLSDVPDDDVHFVGSGPTAPDPTGFDDALAVVRKLRLERLPRSVVEHLRAGARGEREETVKPADATWKRATTVLVGGAATAAAAAAQKAVTMDFHAFWVREPLLGEARVAGAKLAQMALDVEAGRVPIDRPACVVYGGETTVRVTGAGKGGRNQELALAAALSADTEFVLASMGTDGIDGPT
ncbi:MAG TPA: DUF4147 domain-containing protein, partial [Candidatus Thermoplasmatota archaeon]|nr:DUF4147 domain-containing protein [Candidatus Thermoplasmatota archaeon]